MNEKVCSNCGRQNPSDMSFCLNCGQSLAMSTSGGGSNYSSDSAPTVFVPSPKVTQPEFRPLTPNVPSPLHQPKKSRTGFWVAIVGGLGLIVVLIGVGVVGLVAMNWDKIIGEDNRNVAYPSPTPYDNAYNTNNYYPTPSPTPTANRNTRETPTPVVPTTGASAAFDKMWIDYNVTENGQTGMRIHTKFTVSNLKDIDSYLAIYFETREGVRLKDKNQKFYSTDGDVAVYQSLKPGFQITKYDDLTVFMPYDELELSKGDYKLRASAYVIYKNGGAVQHLTYYNFDYSAYR